MFSNLYPPSHTLALPGVHTRGVLLGEESECEVLGVHFNLYYFEV